ncbi:MAG: aspartate-semialdehyde dehydrogenase [Salinisphaera sp.]|jgi:aspartate-semialdehyde dehydrogenase|nr:aspartate-semialdehyde dehydrogenase [Salinisphaera sp.]
MNDKHDIAVIGAHGTSGETLLEILGERGFPVARLHALGSGSTIGRRVQFADRNISVADVQGFDFTGVTLAFFVGAPAAAEQHAIRAADQGCIVIDTTSALALRSDVPLVVPEINPGDIAVGRAGKLIGQPSPAAIHLLLALAPLARAAGLQRVNLATYHAVSSDEERGIGTLAEQTARLLNGRALESTDTDRQQIAFNAIPEVGVIDRDGHSTVERDIVAHARRLLGLPALAMSVTAVRVPVFFGHSLAVHVETVEPFSVSEATALFAGSEGLSLVDAEANGHFATAVTDAAAQDDVFVSRIRHDFSEVNGLDFWIVADNVRKGGVLNGVQIAERLLAEHL